MGSEDIDENKPVAKKCKQIIKKQTYLKSRTRTVSLQVMKCTASSCEAMIQG